MRDRDTIVYFTKEDGQNKMLLTSSVRGPEELEHFDVVDYKACADVLGHKPNNIYVFYQGQEFKVLRTWIK